MRIAKRIGIALATSLSAMALIASAASATSVPGNIINLPHNIHTLGATGGAVQSLQGILAWDFQAPASSLTGTFDAATQANVKSAQSKLGLAQTGKVDATTWQALLNWDAARHVVENDIPAPTVSSALYKDGKLTIAVSCPTGMGAIYSGNFASTYETSLGSMSGYESDQNCSNGSAKLVYPKYTIVKGNNLIAVHGITGALNGGGKWTQSLYITVNISK